MLDHVRHRKNQHGAKDKNSKPHRRQTFLSLDQQKGPAGYIDDACQVSPKQMAWNKGRRQLPEGKSRHQFGVKEMLHADEDNQASNAYARSRDQPMRAVVSPPCRVSRSQRQSSPTEGEVPCGYHPSDTVVWELHCDGNMHECLKEEKHDPNQSG